MLRHGRTWFSDMRQLSGETIFAANLGGLRRYRNVVGSVLFRRKRLRLGHHAGKVTILLEISQRVQRGYLGHG